MDTVVPSKKSEKHSANGHCECGRALPQRQKFLSVSELAARWSISESKIYHRGRGTEDLTRYYIGDSVRLLLEEVEAAEKKVVGRARKHREEWA